MQRQARENVRVVLRCLASFSSGPQRPCPMGSHIEPSPRHSPFFRLFLSLRLLLRPLLHPFVGRRFCFLNSETSTLLIKSLPTTTARARSSAQPDRERALF